MSISHLQIPIFFHSFLRLRLRPLQKARLLILLVQGFSFFLLQFAASLIDIKVTIMRLSYSASCKQKQLVVNFPGLTMEPFIAHRRKDKVVVVVGATGTGKSRLSIDLATRRFPAEVVNSDKMQVYKGLDIVTNKVTEEECCGVPHHLLGIVDPNVDFTATDFRHQASLAVEAIVRRDRLPIIAGGSNSYIKALVNDDIDFQSKYECCFLWVDVSLPVLYSFVSERVDRMVAAGLVDEVRRIFNQKVDYTRGIGRAIGVPEMDRFLRAEPNAGEKSKARLLEAAIHEIKANTCRLARCQLQKIKGLQNQFEWKMHRLDATDAFLKRGDESDEAWENQVVGPSIMIVDQFLRQDDFMDPIATSTSPSVITKSTVIGSAATQLPATPVVAAATL